jgi:hypothetical protein
MASPYYYTQGKFWGGATASTAIYMILAILPITGFLGLDHLYLHSPGTFVIKAIFNILTFGYWYFYDVIQAITHEKEGVSANGLSVPWFGPAGIGAGSFKGDGAPEAPQNNLMYIAYVLSAIFIPFGLDYVIAGDYLGAVFKYMSIFMFGIGLIFGLINLYKIIMNPADVFCEGTYRYFPFTMFADKINPAATFTTKTGCPAVPEGENVSFFDFFRGVVKALDRIPIIGPKLSAPISAAVTTAETTIDTVKTTAETAAKTVEGAVKTVEGAVDIATRQIPGAVQTATHIVDAVRPERLIAAAAIPTKQEGGGASRPSPVMIFTFGLIFLASGYITLQRVFKKTREYFADMPPIAIPGTERTKNDKIEETDVGELPPGASESGIF